MPMRAQPASFVGRHVLVEDMECAAYEIDRAVGVSTRSPSVELAEPALEPCHETWFGLPPHQAGHVIGNRRKDQDTRFALVGTPMRTGHGQLHEDGNPPHPRPARPECSRLTVRARCHDVWSPKVTERAPCLAISPARLVG
jgi:hypothetical protein